MTIEELVKSLEVQVVDLHSRIRRMEVEYAGMCDVALRMERIIHEWMKTIEKVTGK